MTTKVAPDELIRRALDARVGDVWTSFPARVKSYDASKQTADLEPMIRRPIPTESGAVDAEDLPVLPDIPIIFPRGGGDAFAITWPLEAGDFVIVQVLTFSAAGWRRTGELADPGDVRAHSIGNAFATPGAAPSSKTLEQASDSALVIDGTMIKLGKNAVNFVALANLVDQNFDAVKTTFLGLLDSLSAPVTGGSSFSPVSVAATKVKAE